MEAVLLPETGRIRCDGELLPAKRKRDYHAPDRFVRGVCDRVRKAQQLKGGEVHAVRGGADRPLLRIKRIVVMSGGNSDFSSQFRAEPLAVAVGGGVVGCATEADGDAADRVAVLVFDRA